MNMLKKILIIEDEEFLYEMYKMKLEREGYQVVVASDGLEGVKSAKKVKPDLILLDLVLPGMDGYQVLQNIRADRQTKDIKIYILSNLGQNEEIKLGLETGADGYLIKANITPSQLVENIEKIFAGEKVGIRKQLSRAGDLPQSLPDKKKTKILTKERIIKVKKQEKEKMADILIIEDEEAIIEMYKIKLTSAGYQVSVAKNGAWGLKLAREKKFKIIIMDMVMPAMKGCQAIKELKSDDKTKNIPIIVLSNSAQDKDIAEAKACGAACYLLKSNITPAKLIKEVEKLLRN